MGPAPEVDAGDGLEIRPVQPYEARKRYLCPGCNHDIGVGTGHLVVVPMDAPDLRRHWHRSCWDHRGNRHPGRTGHRAP